jgi:hypothetical protein
LRHRGLVGARIKKGQRLELFVAIVECDWDHRSLLLVLIGIQDLFIFEIQDHANHKIMVSSVGTIAMNGLDLPHLAFA